MNVVETTERPTAADADDATPVRPTGNRAARLPALAVGARWAASFAGALLVFAAFLALRGADPIGALKAVWDSAAGDGDALGETLIRATPILFGALAVLVPARAGLFNIGGEGQLMMGAVGAAGMAQALGDATSTPLTLTLMGLGAAAAGAAWAAIPALLRLVFLTNEAITTLLMNYLAALIIVWLVFEPWKDPASLGQAYSEKLGSNARLPVLWGNRVHLGVILAVATALVIWFVLTRTRWGFRLGVLGGNPEAARRAGFRIGGLTVGAMVLGGALAGLGGMAELAGVEARLRPDILAGFGYTAFLASWLARHDPIRSIAASVLLGGIIVGGFGLKIATGLSGGAVQVLIALILLAVLGFAPRRGAAA